MTSVRAADDALATERLADYLQSAVPDCSGSFSVERVGDGNSCLTYLVSGGAEAEDGPSWRFILRRPPQGDLPRGAYDVAREFRVISALYGAGVRVPVPRPIALCEEKAVLGAPFYLMEAVDGLVLKSVPPEGFGPTCRREASHSLVDVLVALHEVDWRAIGLGDYGNPSGYAARQLSRMTSIWERTRFRPLPDVDEVGAWLVANQPPDGPAGIVHGDYRLDNVIVSPSGETRVVAVVDWELSTIGDPLADLGWLLYYWLDDELEIGWDGMPATMITPGFLRRQEVLERYLAHRPSTSMQHVTWYAALAGWKTAIMLEGAYRRYVEGARDKDFASLEAGIPFLARRAREIIDGRLALDLGC